MTKKAKEEFAERVKLAITRRCWRYSTIFQKQIPSYWVNILPQHALSVDLIRIEQNFLDQPKMSHSVIQPKTNCTVQFISTIIPKTFETNLRNQVRLSIKS